MAHVHSRVSKGFRVVSAREVAYSDGVAVAHVDAHLSLQCARDSEEAISSRILCTHLARKIATERCQTITSHLHRESHPQPEWQKFYNISFTANSHPLMLASTCITTDFLLDHAFIGEISAVVLRRGGTLHRSDECMCIPESEKVMVRVNSITCPYALEY